MAAGTGSIPLVGPNAPGTATGVAGLVNDELAELYKRAPLRLKTYGGTAQAITADGDPFDIAATGGLVDGMLVQLIAQNNNTAADPTLAIDLETARAIKDELGAAIPADKIVAGYPYILRYDLASTSFHIVIDGAAQAGVFASLQIGAASHTLSLVSGLPRWTVDTNDFVRFITSTNTWQFSIGGAGEYEIAAAYTGPSTDNANDSGRNAQAWKDVYTVNAVTVTSDKRAKTDIEDLPVGLEFLQQLRPIQYRWKVAARRPRLVEPPEFDESGNLRKEAVVEYDETAGTRHHWGVLAQDVKTALDAAGIDAAVWCLQDKEDADSRQFLRETHLIAPLIHAVQEIADRVKLLESRISDNNPSD